MVWCVLYVYKTKGLAGRMWPSVEQKLGERGGAEERKRPGIYTPPKQQVPRISKPAFKDELLRKTKTGKNQTHPRVVTPPP